MTEWIISSSALIVIVAALRFLLRGKISLRLGYALWALVLVRLLVPVSFGSTGVSVLNAVPEAESRVEGFYADAAPRYSIRSGGEEIYSGMGTPPDGLVDEARDSGEEYSVVYTSRSVQIAPLLRLIWLSGAALMALWLLIANLRFASRLKRTRREYAAAPLRVYISAEIDTPCLFGLFRPAIYVTPAVAGNGTVLRHAVEHETTHYRQLDHVWAFLRCVCLALHWYNPLVWLAVALSRRDAELACDEGTIARLGESERAEYGRTLIGLTCLKRGGAALLCTATTMTGSKSGIKERIILIAKKPKTAIYTLAAVLLVATVAVGCTFTGAKEGDVAFTPDTVAMSQPLSSTFRPDAITDAETVQYLWDLYQSLTFDGTAETIDKVWSIAVTFSDSATGKSERFTIFQGGLCLLGDDYETYHILVDGTNLYQEFLRCFEEAKAAEATPEESSDGPAELATSLFRDGGGATLSLHAQSGNYDACELSEADAAWLRQLLIGYVWTELEAPSTEPSDFWLTLKAADDSAEMRFWSGESCTVQYTEGDGYRYWSGGTQLDGYGDAATAVRRLYNDLELSFERVVFSPDGSAEQAAEQFAREEYGALRMSCEPGSYSGFTDYAVIDWGVREVSAKGDAVVCWFECAFIPIVYDSPAIWAGNTGEGTGEWEGWLTMYREAALQRGEDGYWRCVDFGTGGAKLPETSADIAALIIECMNSDGAYAESAQAALYKSLEYAPASTLKAVGAREEGTRDWLCWTLAYMMKESSAVELPYEGLGEDAIAARERILYYLESDSPAPKGWREVYRDFWDDELPGIMEGAKIIGAGLFDLAFDGVPELTVWQESGFAVIYYNDGTGVYHNLGSGRDMELYTGVLTVEGEPPRTLLLLGKNGEGTSSLRWGLITDVGVEFLYGEPDTDGSAYGVVPLDYSAFVISAAEGDTVDRDAFNRLLNSWRPVSVG